MCTKVIILFIIQTVKNNSKIKNYLEKIDKTIQGIGLKVNINSTNNIQIIINFNRTCYFS